MSKTDVLVFGATGRVGAALVRRLPGYGLSVQGASRAERTRPAGCIEAVSPKVIVYAAAISAPDRCEQDPSTSHRVNVADPVRIAGVAADRGAPFIYYSSDYVFGGPGRYFEDAPVAPLQVYGRDKMRAEQLLLRGNNIVIRLPLLFGSRDFVAEAFAAATSGAPLTRDDRLRYPIPIDHVVRVTAGLIGVGAAPGIYHAVGVDAVTKAEWACYIAGLLGIAAPPFSPAESADLAEAVESPAAVRPRDVMLATHHPGLATEPGTLWAATRARVAELSRRANVARPGGESQSGEMTPQTSQRSPAQTRNR